MSRPGDPDQPIESLAFESFGVRVAIEIGDPALAAPVTAMLPPGWEPVEDRSVARRLHIAPYAADLYSLMRDDTPLTSSVDLETALGILDAEIRMTIAVNVPTGVFIHAGVVAAGNRVIVLPGRSFAGKSTLVEALLLQGATYYSDEFAVVDASGLVTPYPRPLSIRQLKGTGTKPVDGSKEVRAEDLGAPTGSEPLPVGLIAAVRFLPDATWTVEPRTRAQGALILLSHSLTGQSDPGRVLPLVRAAASTASVVEGFRGPADEAATALLGVLESLE
ncbi:MAG: hypothetical protein JWP18_2231 [Solirubrobacterales bacterium]|nr:hypothetical protein [Solirubrobacterales bacterium]